MRIISQDGFYDVPYELIVIECVNRQVFARPMTGREIGSVCELATYKTREKAKKALEMLKERYTDNVFCKNDIQYKIECNGIPEVRNLMMKYEYFQFPKDDEIEV